MRIDRYFHRIRLARSRSVAQSLIAQGHVRVDGQRVVRPSREVRPGQVIALPLGGKVRILRVLHLPARRGPPAEARAAYEELGVDEEGVAT